MEVSFSNSFKKVLKKRIEGTASEDIFWEKLEVFISHPFDSKLKTHKLSGRLKGAWSFSIEYDMRVVFILKRVLERAPAGAARKCSLDSNFIVSSGC